MQGVTVRRVRGCSDPEPWRCGDGRVALLRQVTHRGGDGELHGHTLGPDEMEPVVIQRQLIGRASNGCQGRGEGS